MRAPPVRPVARSLLKTAAFLILVAPGAASAEPAIAVRTGYRCSQCHLNRTGGGLRTPFGSLYAQTTLPERLLRWRDGGNLIPADPDARFAVGGDARFQYLSVVRPKGQDVSSFEVPEANIYGEGRLWPGRMSLYLDLKAGPGGAGARELFALFPFSRGGSYLKVGKFLPPYGWRLPDDASYIREDTGFAYSSPDVGVEFGFEPGRWSGHLAIVNGASGGGETNRSKQFSFLGVRRFRNSRIGVSAANNISSGTTTTQAGLLGGLDWGRLALLGEADFRRDRISDVGKDRLIGYFESDLLIRRGLNLKYAHDWTDPDRSVSTDDRIRDSLGIEYVPLPFLQVRLFVRRSDGPPQVTGARDRQVDLEAHIFF